MELVVLASTVPLQVHILADSVQETRVGQHLQSCLEVLGVQGRDLDRHCWVQGSQLGDLYNPPGDQDSQFVLEVLGILLVVPVDYTPLENFFLDE